MTDTERSDARQSWVPAGMGRAAKTARPAVGVERMEKSGVEGAPWGRAEEDKDEEVVGGGSDGAEEAELGRESLRAEDVVVGEVGVSEGYIVDVDG